MEEVTTRLPDLDAVLKHIDQLSVDGKGSLITVAKWFDRAYPDGYFWTADAGFILQGVGQPDLIDQIGIPTFLEFHPNGEDSVVVWSD